MIVCPNKSLPEWKSLSKSIGEADATLAFIRNGYNIPESAERARELITNRGILESLEALPTLSENGVFQMLQNGDMVVGDQITLDGKNYYKINTDTPDIGRKLGEITGAYGTVLEYNEDYVSVNQQAVENWNRFSSNVSPKSKSLVELSKGFLSRIGVSVREQDDVIKKYGSNGIADFAERIVLIQSGKMDVALPEEALHFFLDMMDQSNPALIEALDKIRTTDIYKQTLEQYKNNPNYKINGETNFSKIRKEALAKYLSNQMMAKEKKDWVSRVIEAIKNFIQNVKIQKSSYDILEDLFYEQNIENLNLNLDSNEIYNQLTDERKAFYETQMKNASQEQQEAVKNVIALSNTVFFHPETHTLVKTDTMSGNVVMVKNPDGTTTPVNGTELKSVTSKLGSDFYSKLENPDTIAEIAVFEAEALDFGGIDPTLEESKKNKKIVEYLVDQLLKEDLTEETLRTIVSSKVADALMQAKENKEKTLFGTGIHSIAESIILGKRINLDEVDPIIYNFMTKDQLRDLIYGTAYEPGIQGILKKLVDEGNILMTEIAVGNGEIGGIIDVIAIDKNGVARIYDFKTKFIREFAGGKKDIVDEFNAQVNTLGNVPVREDDNVIPALIGTRRSRQTKYSQQQSIYKSLLMEAGIPVDEINIIGIPYRIDAESKKISEVTTHVVKIPFNSDFASYLFSNIDPTLDRSKKQDAKTKEDERLEFVKTIEQAKLKEDFVKMLAKLNQLFTYYSKSKDAKKVFEVLNDDATKTNRLKLQMKEVENVLENWDEVSDFFNVQSKFLDFIDSVGPVLIDLFDYYNQISNTVSMNDQAKVEKLNQMFKVKDMLVGYKQMLEDILPSDLALDNPLSASINKLTGNINLLLNNYNRQVKKELSGVLGSEFFEETFETLKREYNEMIAALERRGDKEKADRLRKERDTFTSEDLILKALSGETGDVNEFYSYFMATISNPDIVVAGFARRMKSTLDKVRLQNKDLRDRVGSEFDKRAGVYGRGLDLKEINESLVYVVTELDPQTGDEKLSLHFKSQFDEKLYYDHSKLLFELNKATESEDESAIKKARKKLKDFENKYLQTQFTEEYRKLTKMLDQTVMYQNEETSIREIRASLYEKIRRIQDAYRGESIATMQDISPEHYEELINLNQQLADLGERYDKDGNLKTGDALKIALALEAYDKNRNKLYESIVDQTSFDVLNDKMKVLYGEDSDEYKKWYANNTRLVVSDEYYQKRDELLKEKSELLEKISDSDEVKELYRELSVLTRLYKDKDGFINGSRIKPEVADKIKKIQEKIDSLLNETSFNLLSGYTKEDYNKLQVLMFHKNTNTPYYDEDGDQVDVNRLIRLIKDTAKARLEEQKVLDPDFAVKVQRLEQINKELRTMSKYTLTKYYYDELKKQEELFAESRGISYKDLKSNKEYYNEFRESDWYVRNHKITQVVLYEDPNTGETEEIKRSEPHYQWKRNVPDEKYIQVKPGRHFTKTTLKEFYIDDNNNRVDLLRTDNRDVRGRLKPKTNEEYKREYGKDHPYLNSEYINLKRKYESGSANAKEKTDYENLLFIEDEMLSSQKDLPPSQALGLAVPFLEKRGIERVIESGGKSVVTKAGNVLRGVKRAFKRTEQDVDQEGLGVKRSEQALATINNDQVRYIPVRFSTKGEAKDASYDVWGAMLNYLSSVNRKKALDNELAIANGLEEVLSDAENQPKSDKENRVLSNIYKKYIPQSAKKYINKGTNHRKTIVKSFISSVFYNEEKFQGTDIGAINTQKLVTEINKAVSFSVLAAAPLNWTTNWLSGNVQNLVNSVGSRYFSMNAFAESKKIIYSDTFLGGKYGNLIKDMMSDFSKVGNLSFWGQILEVYDPIQGDFENEFGEKTRFNAFKNVFQSGMYAGKIWGEWEIQMSAFIAFMRNHKIYKDPATGETKVYKREDFITLKVGSDVEGMTAKELSDKKLEAIQEFEALEDDLLTIMELNKDKKLVVKDQFKDVYQFGSKDFSRVVAELHGVQKKINGSYAKFDKTYAEKTAAGGLVFFFRKYLIPLGVNRLGTRRIDWETETLEQGFYLTFWQTYARDLSRFRFQTLYKWNDLSDFEKRAVKKTLADVAVVMLINMAILPLLGYDDDDKKKYKKIEQLPYWKQFSIFVAKKVRSETEQFLPISGISEMKRIYGSLSLSLNQIFEILGILRLGFYHILEFIGGEENEKLYYQKSSSENPLKQKGEAKIKAKTLAILGYKGSTFHPIDAIRAFDNYNAENNPAGFGK